MSVLDLCESTANLYSVSHPPDAAGGRTRQASLLLASVACSIQPGAGQRLTDHGQEGQANAYRVYFASDPDVEVDYEIRPLLTDGSGIEDGRILVCTGTSNDQASRGECWMVNAIERPARP